MTVPYDNLNIKSYLEIFFRRKYSIIITSTIGLLFTIICTFSLPPIYRSSTLILVEPQRISTAYVSPTVTTTVQERLSTVSQQILSRTNLEKIIEQFNLYRSDKKSFMDDSLKRIHIKIGESIKILTDNDAYVGLLDIHRNDMSHSLPMEALVDTMRADIDVKVIGGNNAFTISYMGKDPVLVTKVTNTLASLFIEENLKIREQQVEGTSEFLASEHAGAKKELEKQEKLLKEFKEINMGSLPEQLDSNLRTLDRLQMEVQTVNDSIKNAEDRKIFYEGQLNNLEKQSDQIKSVHSTVVETRSATEKLNQLNSNLTRLQAEFNENYPDILILKNQIRELENQLSQGNSKNDVAPRIDNHDSQLSNISLSPQVQTLKLQQQSLYSELSSLRLRQWRTMEMIKEYEKRVEVTFANEQKLLELARDYETSQKSYQDLLQKRLAARISENLEKRQKAEQFRIVDPAKVPEKPYRPDRLRIVLLGGLASFGLGVGIVLLQDFLKPSYQKPEDFHGTVHLPILATIPRHTIALGKSTALITFEKSESLIAEQYRLLYTRIAHVFEERQQTIFAISSAMEHEGKTITAMNLALVAARDFGKKTLLIEGDIKSPTFTKYLPIAEHTTLYDLLSQRVDSQSVIPPFIHENLALLPFGEGVKNSVTLLSSGEMRSLLVVLRERYDLIVIDGPPILSLPDMHILERLVDGIILVVRAEKTPREAVSAAIDSLGTKKFIGITLNDTQETLSSHYRYSYQKV